MATASNSVRNHPDIDWQNATFHAEYAVLRKLCRLVLGDSYLKPQQLADYSIYAARIDSQNKWQLSRPCEGCMTNLEYFGIKDVYYTNELQGLSHETLMW